ncbi:hypothetical protein [Bradyrhizobium sp. CCBAU 051011]|uniref:hypothetical protein n=1 Tax=Bradyrhizobium sp. CCBAU 051011 TaxID=858422 RepID=UPI001379D33C|nr:hypothetical protein [Bradyrhizobium sp. CCBAU 051011]
MARKTACQEDDANAIGNRVAGAAGWSAGGPHEVMAQLILDHAALARCRLQKMISSKAFLLCASNFSTSIIAHSRELRVAIRHLLPADDARMVRHEVIDMILVGQPMAVNGLLSRWLRKRQAEAVRRRGSMA